MKLSRRSILRSSFQWSFALFWTSTGFYVGLSSIRGRSSSSISDLIGSKNDEVDLHPGYLSSWQGESLSLKRSYALIDNVLKDLCLPRGEVVEIGSYKGKCLDRLSRFLPDRHCWGMDIFDYNPHPKKLIGDIRTYANQHSIALGWNQTSKWTSNPRSKLAAHKFLIRNLVPGGYLVEDNVKWMPKDISLHGLRLVYEDDNYSIFKKVSHFVG